MQGEYLIDSVHNVALQIGPLPSDRIALMQRLNRIGFVQFADSQVKINSGALFSAPALLKKMVQPLGNALKQVDPDLLCGATSIGSALTTYFCIEKQTPMLFLNRIGGGPVLNGDYFPGQKVALIDDLFLTPDTIEATSGIIRSEALQVTDAFVLLDATEGGKEKLAKSGIRLHALFTLFEFLSVIDNSTS